MSTTPNLGILRPAFDHPMNVGPMELLDEALQIIDAQFGESTIPCAAAMTLPTSITSADITLTRDATITLPSNPIPGQTYKLWLIQGIGAPFTVTWATAIDWAGSEAPVLATGAGSKNLITFHYINSTLGWVGEMDANVF